MDSKELTLPPKSIKVKGFIYELHDRYILHKYNKIQFCIRFKDDLHDLKLVGKDMDDCINQMIVVFKNRLPLLKRKPVFEVIKGGKI